MALLLLNLLFIFYSNTGLNFHTVRLQLLRLSDITISLVWRVCLCQSWTVFGWLLIIFVYTISKNSNSDNHLSESPFCQYKMLNHRRDGECDASGLCWFMKGQNHLCLSRRRWVRRPSLTNIWGTKINAAQTGLLLVTWWMRVKSGQIQRILRLFT